MKRKGEVPEPVEQCKTGNVRNARLSGTALRRRIVGVFVIVFSILILTAYNYFHSRHLGKIYWGWFWGREVTLGVVLVFGIVKSLRKAPKE